MSDKVIEKGNRKFSDTLLNTKIEKDVWCINIIKLPLTLAKIGITPKMKKEMPDLYFQLEMYQKRCADVLARNLPPSY